MALSIARDDAGVTDSLSYAVTGSGTTFDTHIGAGDAYVNIRPVRNFESKWGWYGVKITGANGWTPEIRLNAADFYGSTAVGDPVWWAAWSYDLHGNQWNQFSTKSLAGSLWTFTNAAAFTQDTVYVCGQPCFSYTRMQNRIAEWIASPLVRSPPGLATAYTIATMPATTDALGRTIPALPIKVFEISNWAVSTPKRVVTIQAGQHPNERYGYWILERMVDLLLSSDAAAVRLRDSTLFRVIPLVNPQGTWGGFTRSGPSAPEQDHNRYWLDATSPHTTVNALRPFYLAYPSQAYIDCHSRSYESTGRSNLSAVGTEGGGLGQLYFDAVDARHPVDLY